MNIVFNNISDEVDFTLKLRQGGGDCDVKGITLLY